jgi:methylphosphotriester-DNA--protein-cysteine methyltransferase
MIKHVAISAVQLRTELRQKRILIAGNAKLRIYGTLKCASGKRMKKENRVFFSSILEAEQQHYRPCGNCLPKAYKKWKDGII